MNFAEADRRFQELQSQYSAGQISADEFDAELRELMVEDEQGRWWTKSRETGQWNYYDEASSSWVVAEPPQPTPIQPPPQPSAPQPVSYPPPPPVSSTAASQPVSAGMKVVLYVFSFLVPIVGIVVFFIYRSRPHPEEQAVAKIALILGLVSILLSCVCSGLTVLPAMMMY